MLGQAEADRLQTMPKRIVQPGNPVFPEPGCGQTLELESLDRRQKFLMDIHRHGHIVRMKCTYQERHNVINRLARLDIGGSPHQNPNVDTVPVPILESYNGATVKCPHLHLYVEGYDDRWAVPAPPDTFPDTTALVPTMKDFMRYCGVERIPEIQLALQ